MLKKGLLLVVALMVIGFVITPLVQAQTAAQQQELEQIARRSINGLSPQDRQRVIAIMTEVFMAQGIPRQQAATLAEANADSMFMTDVGEMSSQERRQFEEQGQRVQGFEQQQRQLQQANNTWPPAQAFARYGRAIPRPSFNFNGSYEQSGEELKIILEKVNYQQFTQTELTEIARLFEAEFGTTYPAGTYNSGRNWRNDFLQGSPVQISKDDPQRRNTSTMIYGIELRLEAVSLMSVQIVITPFQGSAGGAGGR